MILSCTSELIHNVFTFTSRSQMQKCPKLIKIKGLIFELLLEFWGQGSSSMEAMLQFSKTLIITVELRVNYTNYNCKYIYILIEVHII